MMETVCYAQVIFADISNSILGLVDGDSGSWVVKRDTHEVIGQIVATDILGAAYIIPLCDIFEDIARSLGAAAVGLPAPSDTAAIEIMTSQVGVYNDDSEIPLKDDNSNPPLNKASANLAQDSKSGDSETLSQIFPRHDVNELLEDHKFMSMLRSQVEYYFSIENLSKDMHLRRHMDSQGYVPLLFIATFKRIRELSPNPVPLRTVCEESSVIDYVVGDDDCERLRLRDGWEDWILPWEQRDKLTQNNGPMRVTFKSDEGLPVRPAPRFSGTRQYLEDETIAQQRNLVAMADTLRILRDKILLSDSFPNLGGDNKAAQELEERLQKQGIDIAARDAMKCRSLAELQTRARSTRPSASYSDAAPSSYRQQMKDSPSGNPLKGILKQPKSGFPEPQNFVREGAAPAKADKRLTETPTGALWTEISQEVIDPTTLTIRKERFKVRDDKGDREYRDDGDQRRTSQLRAVGSGSSPQELAQFSAAKPAETSSQQPFSPYDWGEFEVGMVAPP
jgi:hypothetical protein